MKSGNDIHDYNDISTIDQYKLAREAGLSDTEALEVCGKMSRDNARTPVQWNAQVNAGFTTGTPWLKVHSDYKEINVAAQEKDPDSVLNYYRKLTAPARLQNTKRYLLTAKQFLHIRIVKQLWHIIVRRNHNAFSLPPTSVAKPFPPNLNIR